MFVKEYLNLLIILEGYHLHVYNDVVCQSNITICTV